MDYFELIKQNIDTAPLLKEIAENEAAWLVNTARQDSVKPQSNTQTIALRGAVKREDLYINDNQESEWSELSQKFPAACDFIKEWAGKLDGTLSRSVIVRLQPKESVYLHVDHGAYYNPRKRYHLVLQSKEGSNLMSGGEKVKMQEGELWWFDNDQHHQATNKSDDWRIHYIFDILPHKYAELGVNPLSLDEISVKLKG